MMSDADRESLELGMKMRREREREHVVDAVDAIDWYSGRLADEITERLTADGMIEPGTRVVYDMTTPRVTFGADDA